MNRRYFITCIAAGLATLALPFKAKTKPVQDIKKFIRNNAHLASSGLGNCRCMLIPMQQYGYGIESIRKLTLSQLSYLNGYKQS